MSWTLAPANGFRGGSGSGCGAGAVASGVWSSDVEMIVLTGLPGFCVIKTLEDLRIVVVLRALEASKPKPISCFSVLSSQFSVYQPDLSVFLCGMMGDRSMWSGFSQLNRKIGRAHV